MSGHTPDETGGRRWLMRGKRCDDNTEHEPHEFVDTGGIRRDCRGLRFCGHTDAEGCTGHGDF